MTKNVNNPVLTKDESKSVDLPWEDTATSYLEAPPSEIQNSINTQHLLLLAKLHEKGIQKEHSQNLVANLEILKAEFIKETQTSKLSFNILQQQINGVYATLDSAIDKVLKPNISVVEVTEAINDLHDEFYRNKFSPDTKMSILMTVMALSALTISAGFIMGLITLNPIVGGIALLMALTGLAIFYHGVSVAEQFGLHSTMGGPTFFTTADTAVRSIKCNLMELEKIVRNPMAFTDMNDSTNDSDLESNHSSNKID